MSMSDTNITNKSLKIIQLMGAFSEAKTTDDAIDYLQEIIQTSKEIQDKALFMCAILRAGEE